MKKFLLYLLRWQLSTPILAICISKLEFSTLLNTIIANLVGGCIFYWVDKWIFKDKKQYRTGNEVTEFLPNKVKKHCFGIMKQKHDYEFDNEHYNMFNRSEDK